MSRLFRTLLVVLVVLVIAPYAVAAPIQINGLIQYQGFNGSYSLTGDRGFSLDVVHLGQLFGCCSFEDVVLPGQTLHIGLIAIGSLARGQMTLDGNLYPFVGNEAVGGPAGCVQSPFGLGCAFVDLQTRGEALAPAVDGPLTTIVLPVEFVGRIETSPPGTQAFNTDDLVADPALAVLTLQRHGAFSLSGDPIQGWQYGSIRVELGTVPEPTTLLLLGSTLAGLGMLRRLHRKREHGRHRSRRLVGFILRKLRQLDEPRFKRVFADLCGGRSPILRTSASLNGKSFWRTWARVTRKSWMCRNGWDGRSCGACVELAHTARRA